ncbi:hypothetical protein JHK87_042152 [Glycine soja]|nr:hypothetical protein JHK87_042152 [Glycine soja]
MPFPWKKNRVPRISQIVADLQSPKRGGSLVVETGFPTSLIDLFVKNRSRFQKHRSKKPPPPPPPPKSLSATDPPPPPPPSPATSPPPRVPTFPATPIQQNDTAVSAPDRIAQCSPRSGVNAVVLVAKILMVLVLVASVERLTVGITASAFSLLLLEYAGRRVVVSCSVSESWWFQKVGMKERVERIEFESEELSNKGLSIDEIEDVETTDEVGVSCEIGDVALKVLEPCLCDEDVSECKIRPSRSGRFRSKMVKLVSKKFRGSKKEKKYEVNKHNEGESGSEISSAVGEEKLPILEIEVEEENGDNKSSNTKLDCGITCSYDNEKRVERVGNSGSSMVLVMIIALVGLLLGRFPALVLLMTWCCLMKIVGILWRSQNVPMIKCSVSNS